MASASASPSASAANVPNKPRKSSNASSSMESETGRLLTSLGSVGSSLADVGTGLGSPPPAPAVADLPIPNPDESMDDSATFQIPASVPQHSPKSGSVASTKKAADVDADPDASCSNRLREASLPPLQQKQQQQQLSLEESESHTSSKGSRNLPERRLQPKKRKMSYESYDSAMGDSYLGLAPLDGSFLPKPLPEIGSVATKGSGASESAQHHVKITGVSALDHLDALGDDGSGDLPAPAPVAAKKPPTEEGSGHTREDDNSGSGETFTSSGHRLLMEAIMMTSGGLEGGGRKRLESWGGMSDLSAPLGTDHGVNAAAAIAASALHHTGIIDDVTAAANFGEGSVASSVTDDHPMKSYGGEAQPPFGRDRKESTTSFSDTTFPVPPSGDGTEISSDLQKFVAAAVASVGDQLAELAGNIESAAAAVDLDKVHKDDDDTRQESEVSSIATPQVLGGLLDESSRVTTSGQSSAQHINNDHADSKNKSVDTVAATAAAISVDYDAVAAAVDAAHAATGGLDLSAIGEGVDATAIPSNVHDSTASSISSGGGGKPKVKRKLPTHSKKRTSHQISSSNKHPSDVSRPQQLLANLPKSSLSEQEQEEIRERARKAAGYVPPSQVPDKSTATPAKNRALPPLKKRMRRDSPEPPQVKSNIHATPRIANTAASKVGGPVPNAVVSAPVSGSKSGGKEKSTQKWESMFDCLIEFIQEQKEEETYGMPEEERASWVWSGNVPTTYRTKDGKALGRWINNQRSAKSKGTLKEEREQRLVDAGLKWSVLASNSWNEMLDELRIYIKEYTKDGKKWDGNVPTNYRIKARANGKKMTDEDKNLGRWVNRQRSLYQAGKLRKDRQLALEKVGLKWSMLATTSWESMFDTLVEYVEEKTKGGKKWDGNVPANFRTDHNPPRALGRWINRQRSAHVKKKLKKEYVDKLSNLGLKWSVHDRKFPDDIRSDEVGSSNANFHLGDRIGTATENPAEVAPDAILSTGIADQRKQVPSTIAVPSKKVEQQQNGRTLPQHHNTAVGGDHTSCADQSATKCETNHGINGVDAVKDAASSGNNAGAEGKATLNDEKERNQVPKTSAEPSSLALQLKTCPKPTNNALEPAKENEAKTETCLSSESKSTGATGTATNGASNDSPKASYHDAKMTGKSFVGHKKDSEIGKTKGPMIVGCTQMMRGSEGSSNRPRSPTRSAAAGVETPTTVSEALESPCIETSNDIAGREGKGDTMEGAVSTSPGAKVSSSDAYQAPTRHSEEKSRQKSEEEVGQLAEERVGEQQPEAKNISDEAEPRDADGSLHNSNNAPKDIIESCGSETTQPKSTAATATPVENAVIDTRPAVKVVAKVDEPKKCDVNRLDAHVLNTEEQGYSEKKDLSDRMTSEAERNAEGVHPSQEQSCTAVALETGQVDVIVSANSEKAAMNDESVAPKAQMRENEAKDVSAGSTGISEDSKDELSAEYQKCTSSAAMEEESQDEPDVGSQKMASALNANAEPKQDDAQSSDKHEDELTQNSCQANSSALKEAVVGKGSPNVTIEGPAQLVEQNDDDSKSEPLPKNQNASGTCALATANKEPTTGEEKKEDKGTSKAETGTESQRVVAAVTAEQAQDDTPIAVRTTNESTRKGSGTGTVFLKRKAASQGLDKNKDNSKKIKQAKSERVSVKTDPKRDDSQRANKKDVELQQRQRGTETRSLKQAKVQPKISSDDGVKRRLRRSTRSRNRY